MENRFAQNISNEELAMLPLCGFGGEIVVVDTQEAVEAACADLAASPVIGFDTETRPTFRPGAQNKVALLQLSTPCRCYLFRLCKIELDERLVQVLENVKSAKIGADVANDLRALQALRRFTPGGFVDLQSIVAQWGIADKSVRKMAGIILGEKVSKAQRLSNWEASTLTPAQQMYAATDAWVCEQMYTILLRTAKRPLPLPALPRQEITAAKNDVKTSDVEQKPALKPEKKHRKKYFRRKKSATNAAAPEKTQSHE